MRIFFENTREVLSREFMNTYFVPQFIFACISTHIIPKLSLLIIAMEKKRKKNHMM